MRKFMIIMIVLVLFPVADNYAQIPGDFNCNGYPMEIPDFIILMRIIYFNIPPLDTTSCTWYAGDINGDSLYHTIADWMQFIHHFPGDNPPQPHDLDTIAVADTTAAPGESLELPIYIESVDSLSGLVVQLRVDTLFLSNLSITPGSDSLDINQYIDSESIFLDHINKLDAGYYHIANVNFSIREDAPIDTETTIELVAGDYYPSAFANISLPTYLIRPVLINGTVYVQRTGIDDHRYPDKRSFSLSNFPNPFNSSTIIQFSLEAESYVELTVFDILGRQIDRLVDGYLSSGDYRVEWDAGDHPSGVYFYRLIMQDTAVTGRMTLLK